MLAARHDDDDDYDSCQIMIYDDDIHTLPRCPTIIITTEGREKREKKNFKRKRR